MGTVRLYAEPVVFAAAREEGATIEYLASDVKFDIYAANIHARAAAALLGANVRNRPLTRTWVRSLCTEIEAGRYEHTGDPLSFMGIGGYLYNGQHRLHAILLCLSKILMPFLLHVGGTPRDGNVIDGGRKRSLHDIAHLSSLHASVVRAARQLLTVFHGTEKVPAYTLIDEAAKWPCLDRVRELCLSWDKLGLYKNRVMHIVGATLAQHVAGWDHMYAFYHPYLSGEGTSVSTPGHPVYALRQRLLRNRLVTVEARLQGKHPAAVVERSKRTEVELALMLHAWNAYIEARSITSVLFQGSVGKYPKIVGTRNRPDPGKETRWWTCTTKAPQVEHVLDDDGLPVADVPETGLEHVKRLYGVAAVEAKRAKDTTVPGPEGRGVRRVPRESVP